MPPVRKAAFTKCTDRKCRKQMLVHCPIVRMGKGDGKFYNEYIPARREIGVTVIPAALCIGCGICTKKCAHNLTKIYDW